eukprot:908398-Pelagomonas_calceolata.AAC.14
MTWCPPGLGLAGWNECHAKSGRQCPSKPCIKGSASTARQPGWAHPEIKMRDPGSFRAGCWGRRPLLHRCLVQTEHIQF